MRNWVHFLGGSVTVYLLMAACSAGAKRVGSHDDGPSAAAGMAASSGGAAHATGGDAIANAGTSAPSLSGSGGTIGDVIDDMMDPVDDAEAAPTSGTRLKPIYFAAEDGSRYFSLRWRDTLRNEDCFFQQADDGKVRCLPSFGGSATYFTDEGCAAPAMLAPKTAVGCASTPAKPAEYMYVSDSCGANRQRYAVSKTPAAGAVYQKSGTSCTAVIQAIRDLYDFYPLISPEPAPTSAFVAAAEQVE